ncbi:predicted protein [Uncinocarpus reesii 1704]|uniref:Uncharacterized protein n=1 Tax=Uncinocarpus reesii (strain UAMH 1704) TaxID=336963 RepID=C4JGJ7_UNCRE|nr:uncharacterized protein UREG_01188 [Uncinocarpus reesii 1704]EEP76339.1 predicted protein [Uncinocarpus reesii 1704]
MASLPQNIRGSASQLFFQDKQTSQYAAQLAISKLAHPDRAILATFVEDAADPEVAAKYLLREISPEDSSTEQPLVTLDEFLSRWKTLVEKFRPVQAVELSSDTKLTIFNRDGGCCCVTDIAFKSPSDPNLVFIHIVPPSVFTDPSLSEGAHIRISCDCS